MLTFSQRRNLYGQLTNNTTSGNLANGDIWMGESDRRIIASHEFSFTESSSTASTVNSQQFYELPADCQKLISPTITVGTIKYTPQEAPNKQWWDRLNQVTSFSSAIPQWYYQYGTQVGFWPVPSSTANVITWNFRKKQTDLTLPDHKVGTINTATAGSTIVLGNTAGTTTSWTASMAGRWLRIDSGTTAINSGDENWYQVSSVTSATVLVLTKPYIGSNPTSGTATYTLGQVSLIPEEFQILPVYEAVQTYWNLNNASDKAQVYRSMFNEKYEQLITGYGTKTTSVVVDEEDGTLINPNLSLML